MDKTKKPMEWNKKFVNNMTSKKLISKPLFMEFFKKEYWSHLPFPPPGDLLNTGIEPTSPVSIALQADSLPADPSGKPHISAHSTQYR